ncbi:acylphosphatase [Microlunatus spumicola]|uniref:acylphosphatase n=1 Tax=Microlunatus spumicola TaxID=81499 RepID=A0ABP6Y2G6_9ACTN
MSVPAPDRAVVRDRVVVTGRVQNVTFRESTRRQAEAHGVVGWVRNLPDGSVVAELEGPRTAVDEVEAWMRRGPLLASVDDVAVTPSAPTGEGTFEVR